jgi:HTH-type transcriptional regulator / antitoxin HipB
MDYLLQTPAQLATHLRSLRKAKSLTQTQLGQLVGLDQSRIAKIERNPRLISVGQLLKILNALSVQVILQSERPPAKSQPPTRPPDCDPRPP